MSDDQRSILGIRRHDRHQTYDRLDYLFIRVSKVLAEAPVGVLDGRPTALSSSWFANSVLLASVPREYVTTSSIAVDGTDIESWGAFHGDVSGAVGAELRFDESTRTLVPVPRGGPRRKGAPEYGPDGLPIYTLDRDARAGHRSATNSRSQGFYIGYEAHLAVQTRDVHWTNFVDRVSLSGEVPGLVLCLEVRPANSHRGRAIVDSIVAMRQRGYEVEDVVWDRGYSQLRPETTGFKLQEAGIGQTIQLMGRQRGVRPFAGDALLLDGQLYSRFLPAELHDLPMPPLGATDAEKRRYEESFNRRARWRMVRHAAPDQDGATRWRCPFCAGRLRCRRFPKTMRLGHRVPLIDDAQIPAGVTRCCDGTFTVMPVELPLYQRLPYGTTAWRTSIGRRQVVESVNAALKGGFTDLKRGFFRVFGRDKITMLLGFTVAGLNADRLRSWRGKMAAMSEARARPNRARRRRGTWRDVVERAPGPLADSPP